MATIVSDLVSHLQAGEAIAANDAIYIDSATGKIFKFNATDDTQVFAGIAKESGILNAFIRVSQSGRIKGFTGLTPGAFVYASTTVPGGFQLLEPTASQKIVLGIAKSATELVINGGLGIKPGGEGGATPQLLLNGGFEEGDSDWTLTAGSALQSSESVVGESSLEVSLTAEALELFQDSTLNQPALDDGVQGLAYIRVKTALSGIKVCFRQAGVTSTSLCVDVNNNNKWGLYKLPVILGGTSNGIAVTSEGVVKTGTIIVDDAFVGAQDVKQDVSACNSIECETEFSAFVTGAGVVSGENYNFINGNCTKPSVGSWKCDFSASVFSEPPKCWANRVIGIATYTDNETIATMGTTTTSSVHILSTGPQFNGDFNIICQRSGTDFTNAKLLAGGSIYSTASDSFSTDTNTLTHKPSVAITAADPIGTFNTYSYAANTNTKTICTAAPSTLPTKADGFRIFTRAFNVPSTCGNPARVEIKIAQPGTSLPTLSKEIYKNTGKGTAGNMGYHLFGASSEGSRGFQINSYDAATGVLVVDSGRVDSTVTLGSEIRYSDGTTATSGYLFINAQKMKDAIVGDFTNIEKCADDYECTDTFSAYVGATGVVSGENLNWINGNATISDTSSYLLNFNASVFTESPVCVAQTFQGGDVAQITASASIAGPSSVSVRTGYQASGTGHVKQPYEFRIICQKTGADYKPKTAKIASSIGVVKSEGASGEVDIQSVYFAQGAACTTGNCTLDNRVGGKITSVSFVSTGCYNVNGIDGTKYNCSINATTSGNSFGFATHFRGTSSSSFARVCFGTGVSTNANALNASVTCYGNKD